MIRKLLFAIAALLFISNANAQQLHTHWDVKAVKVNALEYDIVFSVKIDPNWEIYSTVPSIPKSKDESVPNATTINFNQNGKFELVGKIKESKPKTKMDPVFETNVSTFEKSATFTQRIKLSKAGAITLDGKYEYQICRDGACEFPPAKKFSVSL